MPLVVPAVALTVFVHRHVQHPLLVQETLNEVLESEMDGISGSGQERSDEDALGLPFRILPARSDDEGG